MALEWLAAVKVIGGAWANREAVKQTRQGASDYLRNG